MLSAVTRSNWIRPSVLAVYLVAWTLLLVIPDPLETLGLKPVVSADELEEFVGPVSYGVHVAGYFILGALIASLEIRDAPRWLTAGLWLGGVAHGALTEFVQSFVPSREGDLWDFAADVAGVLLGALIGRWVFGPPGKKLTERPQTETRNAS